MPHKFLLLFLCAVLLCACKQKPAPQTATNGAFAKAKPGEAPNLERITASGELIVGTISGPDTYFDYQGRGMGLQYALVEDFAQTQGVGVRVELANDTLRLIKMLQAGDIDLIALQLPESLCRKEKIAAAGAADQTKHTTWAVSATARDLAEALDYWYGEGVEVQVEKQERTRMRERTVVRRKVRAPFISREKGIISTYDAYFKEAAQHVGWDWRLIAAQCYQESGFDPNAVSWAGARGLMQLMPATAAQHGLPETRIFGAKENIATAARHIRFLQGNFQDIREPEEQAKFVLAAYNGGLGHVRDAQALARKHGGNPNRWSDVGFYVRNLSLPRYYRDAVVKHGYMIGAETYGYVQNIMERWRAYGGNVLHLPPAMGGAPGSAAAAVRGGEGAAPSRHKRNRYSKERQILTAEEMLRGQ